MAEDKATLEETAWSGVTAELNQAEAQLVAGFLRDHDIPARVMDNSFHMTPSQTEDLTAIEVAVPTSRLEEAKAVLAKRQNAFVATDGSESIMTDEGPADIDDNQTSGNG